MIFGIGVDIIKISRFEKSSTRFLKKIFSKCELDYLANKNLESFAGMFAAKEAVAKSLGTGFKNFAPCEIEIMHKKNKKIFVKLNNNALIISRKLKIKSIKISIAHEKKYAIAFAIAEN